MIEVSISHDKELNSLSEFAQLLYLKILPHTDDFGRFEADPELVKARVDPLSKRKILLYKNAIQQICEQGLAFVYETKSGKKIIQYNPISFERINAFLIKKRGNSEFPEFNKELYKVIYGDITYKAVSKKQKVEGQGGVGGKEVVIPTYEEFLTYAKTLKIWRDTFEFQLQAKYNAWKDNDWKDGFNKPIKVWKSKLQNTIVYFKENGKYEVDKIYTYQELTVKHKEAYFPGAKEDPIATNYIIIEIDGERRYIRKEDYIKNKTKYKLWQK